MCPSLAVPTEIQECFGGRRGGDERGAGGGGAKARAPPLGSTHTLAPPHTHTRLPLCAGGGYVHPLPPPNSPMVGATEVCTCWITEVG